MREDDYMIHGHLGGWICMQACFSSYAAIHHHTIAIIRGFLATHQHEIMHMGEAVSIWLAERQFKFVHTKTHAKQWLNVFDYCIFSAGWEGRVHGRRFREGWGRGLGKVGRNGG